MGSVSQGARALAVLIPESSDGQQSRVGMWSIICLWIYFPYLSKELRIRTSFSSIVIRAVGPYQAFCFVPVPAMVAGMSLLLTPIFSWVQYVVPSSATPQPTVRGSGALLVPGTLVNILARIPRLDEVVR